MPDAPANTPATAPVSEPIGITFSGPITGVVIAALGTITAGCELLRTDAGQKLLTVWITDSQSAKADFLAFARGVQDFLQTGKI